MTLVDGKGTAFQSIPLVDLAPLDRELEAADTSERATLVQAVRAAASEVGFLYVKNHGVDPRRIAQIEQAAREFFALPAARKQACAIHLSSNHRGYVAPGEEVFYGQTQDTKEAFDLSRELPAADYGAAQRFLGPNQWPEALPGFRAAVEAYYEDVFALGRRLLGVFALALGVAPERFLRHVHAPPSQLRLLHYPARPQLPGASGIGAHTDYECFTLLHATQPGLEVMNGHGQWVKAPPLPGAFVVNIGDLLEVWSNGQFLSTSHRVAAVSEQRYAFPLFFNVDYATLVEPLPELCQGGARYAGLVAGEHLLAQTVQTFRYLREQAERGELVLPAGARELSSFGRERAQG